MTSETFTTYLWPQYASFYFQNRQHKTNKSNPVYRSLIESLAQNGNVMLRCSIFFVDFQRYKCCTKNHFHVTCYLRMIYKDILVRQIVALKSSLKIIHCRDEEYRENLD